MGNAVICNEQLDGSINDIFRLIFMPKVNGILEMITKHIKIYPESINMCVECNILDRYIDGTPLYLAIKYIDYSSVKIIKLLIDLGADCERAVECDKCGELERPIIACVRHMNYKTYEILELLLNNGVKVDGNLNNDSVLTEICIHPTNKLIIKCLKLVLQYKPKINNVTYSLNHPIGCYFSKVKNRTPIDWVIDQKGPTSKYKLMAIQILQEYYVKRKNK